jgi:hypothetical protein
VLKKSCDPGGGWLVKCDGCGKETLAEVFPDRIIVVDRRHGNKHIAVIQRCELLKIMNACPCVSNERLECEPRVAV